MHTNSEPTKAFAYIKYEGTLVQDGFLDARKAGEALLGIDEALRHFLYQEDSSLQKAEFEIPVSIKKGSWEAVFMENFDTVLLKSTLSWGASKYFDTALNEVAQKGFNEFGFKDLFKNAFKSMTWVIKIAKHLGSLTRKKVEHLEYSGDNKVSIINTDGRILLVPTQYLKAFASCPNDLFTRLAKVIEEERQLIIGYNDGKESNYVRINSSEKFIFIPHEDEDEVLFPELAHNTYAELEGHITRGNEHSNTMGFLYQDHILTCYPNEGNIKSFKGTLFTNVTVKGFIDRLDKRTGEFIEKRPKFRFVEIVSNEPEDRQLKLF
ncbi:hypothetical protein ACFSKU_06980 [Pontibacter silvestris]|uniref:Uncharacterized protein n=1 Tax=Pontibacter silvestris TaxID=2305183 RepID=A0ABW4WVC4_9BACT|nr:hypothetical protein [Pontibacter silvestris]MCC9136533.1 hypothetical protein [Pontibacter silvestris]